MSAMVTRLFRVSAQLSTVGAAALTAGLLLAACGSSGGSGGGATSTGGAGTSGGSGGATSRTVVTRTGPLGSYLTDGTGKTLYMFASDTPTKSTCTGACLTYWPPLSGKAKAGAGVTASKFGTIKGTTGASQVTYAGHPLYYFAQDSKPGDMHGQGSSNFGAKWWILTPSGQPIERTATAMPSSSSPAGGGYS